MSNATDTATTEQWWITTGGWLPGGVVHVRHGVEMGPFPSRELALEVRAMVEASERRTDLFVGRSGERDIHDAA